MRDEKKNVGIGRKQSAAMNLSLAGDKKELKERTEEMKKLYAEVYSDRSLRQIAMNILNYYLQSISSSKNIVQTF